MRKKFVYDIEYCYGEYWHTSVNLFYPCTKVLSSEPKGSWESRGIVLDKTKKIFGIAPKGKIERRTARR